MPKEQAVGGIPKNSSWPQNQTVSLSSVQSLPLLQESAKAGGWGANTAEACSLFSDWPPSVPHNLPPPPI